jgi:hypothetical protein
MFGAVSQACWPAWGSGLLLTALALAALAAAVYLALKHSPGTRSPAAISLRQLTGAVQMFSVVAAFRLSSTLRAFLGWTDVANGSILSFGPLACGALQMTFIGQYLLTLALPFVFAAAVALLAFGIEAVRERGRRSSREGDGAKAWSPGALRGRRGGFRWPCARGSAIHARTPQQQAAATGQMGLRGSGRTIVTRNPVLRADLHNARAVQRADSARSDGLPSTTAVPKLDGPPSASAVAAAISTRTRIISVLLMLTALFYMPLLSASVRALDCYDQPVDSAYYLRADLRVTCYTGSHAAIRVLAACAIVLLAVVLPGALMLSLCTLRGGGGALRLRSSRAEVLSGEPARGNLPLGTESGVARAEKPGGTVPLLRLLRPLYDGYDVRRGLLWYEAVVFVRKALLVIAGTLIAAPIVASGTVTFILVGATCVQASLRPYETDDFNRSELVTLWGACVAAALATLLATGAGGSAGAGVLVVAILVIAFAVFAYLLWCWYRTSRGLLGSLAARASARFGSLRHLSFRAASLTGLTVTAGHVPLPPAAALGAVNSSSSRCGRTPPQTAGGVLLNRVSMRQQPGEGQATPGAYDVSPDKQTPPAACPGSGLPGTPVDTATRRFAQAHLLTAQRSGRTVVARVLDRRSFTTALPAGRPAHPGPGVVQASGMSPL